MKTLIYTVLDLKLMHCTYKQIKNNMKSKFVQPITDGLSVDFIGTVGLGMIPSCVNGIGSWYVSILINILKNLHKNDYIFMETDYPLLQFFFVNESRQLKTIKLAQNIKCNSTSTSTNLHINYVKLESHAQCTWMVAKTEHFFSRSDRSTHQALSSTKKENEVSMYI